MNRLQSPSGEVLPASDSTLIYFASYLARSVRHCTIKLYLAAVHNLRITVGFSDPIKGKPLLCKVLKGIFRFQGDTQIHRQLVTPRLLGAIRPILQSWPSPGDFSMIWAAFTLAFFAFSTVASLLTLVSVSSVAARIFLLIAFASIPILLACST